MYELGKKDQLPSTIQFESVENYLGLELKAWPRLKAGFNLVCGYNQGLGERMIVCENLAEAQSLYEKYSQGWALSIAWYQTSASPQPTAEPAAPSAQPIDEAALKTQEGVRDLMASSRSKAEWNSNCDAVKKANGGKMGRNR